MADALPPPRGADFAKSHFDTAVPVLGSILYLVGFPVYRVYIATPTHSHSFIMYDAVDVHNARMIKKKKTRIYLKKIHVIKLDDPSTHVATQVKASLLSNN